MHDESGPRRLRQGTDTPEPLLRAIDALRKGVDDSARLSRVGQKLEAVLNAPPTAAPFAERANQAAQAARGGGLSTFKLILGGLALIVALTPLFFLQHADDGAVPGADRDGSSGTTSSATSSQTPVAAAPLPQAEEQAASARADAPAPTVAVAPVETASAERTTQSLPVPRRSAKHAAHLRERASREAAAERVVSADNHTSVAKNTPASTPTEPAPSATKQASASTPAEPAEAPKRPQGSGEKLKQPQEAPPAPAEADLLLKARKALKVDPELALRLAAEHQGYYPKGRLVPEREVLAIEALRNLGRKQEADERLKRFEARYPKSIHLQRLHESK